MADSDQPANAGQLATVLEQIADNSSGADIRSNVRQVVKALRGEGLVILNGPPQEAMRRATPVPYDPVPDLACLLTGLQTPRCIAGGAALGAAQPAFDRLREGLALSGWTGAADHARALLRARARELARAPDAATAQLAALTGAYAVYCAACESDPSTFGCWIGNFKGISS